MAESKALSFVEFIVNGIVENQEKVHVSSDEFSDRVVVITVKVARDDMGKLIGKNGKMAKSIRTLLKAIGALEQKRISLKIDEPED